jgi:hypothetical protein
MAENILIVDHFPNVLRHFSNDRLLKLMTHYTRVAQYDGADRFVYEIATKCQDECQRRGLHIPRLRRRQRRLVA